MQRNNICHFTAADFLTFATPLNWCRRGKAACTPASMLKNSKKLHEVLSNAAIHLQFWSEESHTRSCFFSLLKTAYCRTLHGEVVSAPSTGWVVLLDFSYAQMRDLHVTSNGGTEVTKKYKQAACCKVITFPLLFYSVNIQNIDLYSKLPFSMEEKHMTNCSHIWRTFSEFQSKECRGIWMEWYKLFKPGKYSFLPFGLLLQHN